MRVNNALPGACQFGLAGDGGSAERPLVRARGLATTEEMVLAVVRRIAQGNRSRIVVEAAGVEPASEKVNREKTTCVSDSVVFVRLMRNRQERGGLA